MTPMGKVLPFIRLFGMVGRKPFIFKLNYGFSTDISHIPIKHFQFKVYREILNLLPLKPRGKYELFSSKATP